MAFVSFKYVDGFRVLVKGIAKSGNHQSKWFEGQKNYRNAIFLLPQIMTPTRSVSIRGTY